MTAYDFANSDVPVVLSMASSDSGAGSGVQADLKTFSVLDVFGTCAITAVTAQTPRDLRHIHPVPRDVLMQQIQAVSDDFPISAAKTGMLPTADLVEAVCIADDESGIPILVVDPRMVSHHGTRLMEPDAVALLKSELLPRARVVTPNVHEAEILAGFPIAGQEDLQIAAEKISSEFQVACVAKGGDLQGNTVVDVLVDEGELHLFEHERIPTENTHGAGCTFSAALTANIAKGMLLPDAVREARDLVTSALSKALQIGPHHPLHLSF